MQWGTGAGSVGEGGQKLGKNSSGMGLGVRGQGAYGQPGDTVEGGFAEFEFGGRTSLLPATEKD
jgi:hypothetical protein